LLLFWCCMILLIAFRLFSLGLGKWLSCSFWHFVQSN